jgi:hypothetical protein
MLYVIGKQKFDRVLVSFELHPKNGVRFMTQRVAETVFKALFEIVAWPNQD